MHTAGRHLFAVEHVPHDGEFTLDGDAGHHAVRVLRIKPGEAISVTDGRGAWASLCALRVSGATLHTRVLDSGYEEQHTPRLSVVQALPKHERAQITLELLTELGVDEILPWRAAHSVGQWRGERGEKALRKWRSTALTASLQSRRVRFPEVCELASSAEIEQRVRASQCAVLLHETADVPIRDVVSNASLHDVEEILLIVGPEGSFSSEEVETFTAAGAHRVALGPIVLRTSTAGAAALAVVNSVCGRW